MAAEFHGAQVPYVVCARGTQLRRLSAEGLHYQRPSGTRSIRLHVKSREDLRLHCGDVLLLCVKTQDVEAVTSDWADLPVQGGSVAADLPLVMFQNGLAAETIALRRFPRLYGASIKVPAVHLQPGRISVASSPQLAAVTVGRFPNGRDTITAALVDALRRANCLAEERDDIPRWKAAKLLHNVKNVLELFSGQDDAAADHLVAEARVVLTATGLDPARPEESGLDLSSWTIARGSIGAPAGQSTWQSFTRGARSEVDYLNGEIALLGSLHGIPTPWNRAAQRLAARLAASGGAPGSIDIAELAELAATPQDSAA